MSVWRLKVSSAGPWLKLAREPSPSRRSKAAVLSTCAELPVFREGLRRSHWRSRLGGHTPVLFVSGPLVRFPAPGCGIFLCLSARFWPFGSNAACCASVHARFVEIYEVSCVFRACYEAIWCAAADFLLADVRRQVRQNSGVLLFAMSLAPNATGGVVRYLHLNWGVTLQNTGSSARLLKTAGLELWDGEGSLSASSRGLDLEPFFCHGWSH